ncbi:MAG: diphthine--ammonia ligase [Elusimicrobia bacterium]|nr:diphthine--ammonia ligase [Elusimicrobiota bacterium]
MNIIAGGKMRVIASWSGGKDSCFAYYKALQEGHQVLCLLNFISRESQRGCFHGIEKKLMQVQSEAIGIPLIQKETSPDMKKYEEEFKSAVLELKKEKGIEGMVFGDIYLDEHKEWVERVCKDIGIIPVEPLWNLKPENILSDFINLKFNTVVVSAKHDLFDENFIGQKIDNNTLKFLINKGICPCGENGEFHTFVYDGPIFKKKINLSKTAKIVKEGFWKYWFLDIKEYNMEAKC